MHQDANIMHYPKRGLKYTLKIISFLLSDGKKNNLIILNSQASDMPVVNDISHMKNVMIAE